MIRGNQVRVFGPQTITNKGSQLTHNEFRMSLQSSFEFTSCAGTRCTRKLWWCCRVVRFGTGAESKQPLTWCDCRQRLSGHMDRNWWCEQVLRNQFAAPHFQHEFKLALLLPPCHPGLHGVYTLLIAYIVVGFKRRTIVNICAIAPKWKLVENKDIHG